MYPLVNTLLSTVIIKSALRSVFHLSKLVKLWDFLHFFVYFGGWGVFAAPIASIEDEFFQLCMEFDVNLLLYTFEDVY